MRITFSIREFRMDGAQFIFETDSFADTPEKLEENVNGIAGHSLADWLAGQLKARGIDASPVWAEDHGWDFSVAHDGAKYLVVCAIEAEEGALSAQVQVSKLRSMMDKLRGRNAWSDQDGVAAGVRSALQSHAAVRNLRAA